MPSDRTILKFNGAPITVALSYAKGKAGDNGRGAFFTYTVEGNKVFFASPALDAAIQDQTPTKGTRLSVVRTGDDDWDVKRLDPPAEQPKTCNQAITQPAGVVTASNSTVSVPTLVQYGVAFADFLILATDAVRMAERNSPAGSVRFDNRDVAAIATTMFIAADKAGALVWNGAAQGGR